MQGMQRHVQRDAKRGKMPKVRIAKQDHSWRAGIQNQGNRDLQRGAISIKQTMPMRGSIEEYFREDFSLELKSFDKY